MLRSFVFACVAVAAVITAAAASTITGFTGAFAPGTVTWSMVGSCGTGSVDLSGAPASVSITGCNDGVGGFAEIASRRF